MWYVMTIFTVIIKFTLKTIKMKITYNKTTGEATLESKKLFNLLSLAMIQKETESARAVTAFNAAVGSDIEDEFYLYREEALAEEEYFRELLDECATNLID